MARQAIVAATGETHAYEVLFRGAEGNNPGLAQNDCAMSSVVIYALGMCNQWGAVTDGMYAFINVDAEFLLSEAVLALPPDRVVLEILESVEVNQTLVNRIERLRRYGFRFAFDDVIAADDERFAMCRTNDYIKVDIISTPRDQIQKIATFALALGGILIAEKIESQEEIAELENMGFSRFQGFAVGTPEEMKISLLPTPSGGAVDSMKSALCSGAPTEQLTDIAKGDHALLLHLLLIEGFCANAKQSKPTTVSQLIRTLPVVCCLGWLRIIKMASEFLGPSENDNWNHSSFFASNVATDFIRGAVCNADKWVEPAYYIGVCAHISHALQQHALLADHTASPNTAPASVETRKLTGQSVEAVIFNVVTRCLELRTHRAIVPSRLREVIAKAEFAAFKELSHPQATYRYGSAACQDMAPPAMLMEQKPWGTASAYTH